MLDDYTAEAGSRATPEMAEQLLRLYELEGLYTRLHEAYYRAAIEWNGVGDTTMAVKYATLSISRGQIMAGPDRPFIVNMRKLMEDPKGHWTWGFRQQKDGVYTRV